MKKTLSDIMLLGAGTAVQRISVFLSFVIVSRMLGVEQLGIYSFAFVVLQFFMVGQDMGLTNIGARNIALQRSNTSYLILSIFRKRLVLSICALILGSVYIYFSSVSVNIKIFTLLIIASNIPYIFSLEWLLWGSERFLLLCLWRVGVGVIYISTILLGLFALEMDLDVVIVANFLSMFLVVSIFIIFFYKKISIDLHSDKKKPDYFEELKWKNIFRLGSAMLLNRAFHSVDTLMLVALSSALSAGIYTSAYRIIFLIFGIMYLVLQVVYPKVVKSDISYKNLIKYVMILLSIGSVLSLFIIGYAEWLLFNIFDVSDKKSVVVLKYLAIAIPFDFVVSMLGVILIAWGLNKYNLWAIFFATIINIVLNYFYIPIYGEEGAALVTLVSYFCLMLYLMFIFIRVYKEKIQIEVGI
ncbi:MAG: polysaccharide biosynthesis C-terminal domain-containing protein [Pseudomonadota bacterium]